MIKPQIPELPNVGDRAPAFSVETQKGRIDFPEYIAGHWCIFFAHPANFTSAWTMFSSFIALKERWFTERNTKLLALVNEPCHHDEWQDKVRRYIGIFLKAPIVEDPDYTISNIYGMASGRRQQPGFDRIIFIIDPEGVIRVVVNRPLPSIVGAVQELERELDRLQGKTVFPEIEKSKKIDLLEETNETPDHPTLLPTKPAYFPKGNIILN